MRNDTGKALNPWAYDEATETVTVFIPELQRECQIMNYARRRTGDWFLDTGSTPVWSTKRERRRTLTRIMEEFQSADNMVAGWNFFTLQEIAFL